MTNAELIARVKQQEFHLRTNSLTADERHELAVASIRLAYALEQVTQERDRAREIMAYGSVVGFSRSR
jgi:hypothetical protein